MRGVGEVGGVVRSVVGRVAWAEWLLGGVGLAARRGVKLGSWRGVGLVAWRGQCGMGAGCGQRGAVSVAWSGCGQRRVRWWGGVRCQPRVRWWGAGMER